ncbi:MAG: mitochondrial fission ELM1 family protein [Pseudomonadales bacterium]|nr:mitochondrial fission ELM1 family protein [Pseudomonadales bacterium]
MESQSKITIWRFTDENIGHDQQSLGLIGELANQVETDVYTVSVEKKGVGLMSALRGRYRFDQSLPSPDLIIGAGHRTHIPMLSARANRGGKIIVLMKPSLPLSWFDLSLVPEHDGVKAGRESLHLTQGVLNGMKNSRRHDVSRGVFLIGGPCKHSAWSDEGVCAQVANICRQQPTVQYCLTNSRRTPDSFLQKLRTLSLPNLKIQSYTETPSDWVSKQLTTAHQSWVSADSVSMVYEALTAGSSVGIIDVPLRENSRIANGLKNLVEQNRVIPYRRWAVGNTLRTTQEPLVEARRCAEFVRERWLRHVPQRLSSAVVTTLVTEKLVIERSMTKTSMSKKSVTSPRSVSIR